MARLSAETIQKIRGGDVPVAGEVTKSALPREKEIEFLQESRSMREADFERKKAIRQEAIRLRLASRDLSPDEAYRLAEEKIDNLFGRPMTAQFDKKERGGLLEAEPQLVEAGTETPTIPEALAPRILVSPLQEKETARIARDKSREFPTLNEEELEGLTEQEEIQTRSQYAGAQAAWHELKKEYPDADGRQLAKEFDYEIGRLGDVLSGDRELIQSEMKNKINDPLYIAFTPQITNSAVPDLTEIQRAYLQASTDKQRILMEPQVWESLDDYTVMEGSGVAGRVHSRPATDAEKEEEFKRRILETVPELEWWADPDKKNEVLENYSEFIERGLFTGLTTPVGASVESPLGTVLRGAFAVTSIATTSLFRAMEKGSEALEDIPLGYKIPAYIINPGFLVAEHTLGTPGRAKEREQRPEVFQDDTFISDITYNLAKNRWAADEVGNMWEQTEALKDKAWVGYMGGFALDLLIPIDGGAYRLGKAAYAGAETARITARAAGAKSAGEFLKDARAAGFSKKALGELNFLTRPDWGMVFRESGDELLRAMPVFGKRIAPAGLRLKMGQEVGSSLLGYLIVHKALNRGASFEASISRAAAVLGDESNFIRAARKLGEDEFLRGMDRLFTTDEATSFGNFMRVLEDAAWGRALEVPGRDVAKLKRYVRAALAASPEEAAKIDIEKIKEPLAKIGQILGNERIYNEVVRIAAWDEGMKLAAGMTENWKGIPDVVMLTKNVWASAPEAEKILKSAGETTLAQKIRNSTKGEVVTRILDDELIHGWEISYDSAKAIAKELTIMSRMGAIEPYVGHRIVRAMNAIGKDGKFFLSTADIRLILNAKIDDIARGTRKVITRNIINRWAPELQEQMLKPIPARDYSKGFFEKIGFLKENIPMTQLDVAARGNVEALQRGVNSLDKKLKTELGKLTGNPQNHPKFREMLGVAPSRTLRRDDALAVLIARPNADGKVKDAGLILQNIFDYYTMYTTNVPRVGNYFNKIIYSKGKSFLNKSGIEYVEGVIAKHADNFHGKDMDANKMRIIVGNFLEEIREGLTKNQHLYIEPSHLAKKGKLSFLGEQFLESVMATTYYKTEAQRMIRATIKRTTRSVLDEIRYVADFDDVLGYAGKQGVVPGYKNSHVIQKMRELTRLSGGNPLPNSDVAIINQIFNRHLMGMLEETLMKRLNIPLNTIRSSGRTLGAWSNFNSIKRLITQTFSRIHPADAINMAKQPEIKELFRIVTGRAEEYVDIIIKRNGLVESNAANPMTAIDKILGKNLLKETTELKNLLEAPYKWTVSDYERIADLAFGRSNKSLIQEIIADSDNLKAAEKLMEELHASSSSNAKNILRLLQSIPSNLNAFRYGTILGLRPTFHGRNLITAPSIVYGTLGIEGLEALRYTPRAAETVFFTKSEEALAKMVARDPSGKVWTRGEVLKAAIEGGAIRSQASFQINEAMIDNALELAKLEIRDPSKLKQYKEYIKKAVTGKYMRDFGLDLAEKEDNIFRMSNIIYGLEKGEDLNIALARGRYSMFDYGGLGPGEKWWATRVFMFYTFTRMNVVQTMKNLINNPNRLKNALVVQRDSSKLILNAKGKDYDEISPYIPDYMRSRPVMDFVEGIDMETYYTFYPEVVPIEGMRMAIETMDGVRKLDLGKSLSVPIGMLAPELKLVAGDKFIDARRANVIDPRDIAAFKYIHGFGLLSALLQEEPTPVAAKAGESTYAGSRWVVSERGFKNYKTLLMVTSLTGVPALIPEYTRLINTVFNTEAQGRSLEAGRGTGAERMMTAPAELIGGVSEVGAITPAEARAFGARERTQTIRDYTEATEPK